jgi:hypothetical protein
MTSAAVLAAGTASGAGLLTFLTMKLRALRRRAKALSPSLD